MKISTNGGEIILEDVYSGITLKTDEGLHLNICMRDSGYELSVVNKESGRQHSPTLRYSLTKDSFSDKNIDELIKVSKEEMLFVSYIDDDDGARKYKDTITSESKRLNKDFVYYTDREGSYIMSHDMCEFWERFKEYDDMLYAVMAARVRRRKS